MAKGVGTSGGELIDFLREHGVLAAYAELDRINTANWPITSAEKSFDIVQVWADGDCSEAILTTDHQFPFP